MRFTEIRSTARYVVHYFSKQLHWLSLSLSLYICKRELDQFITVVQKQISEKFYLGASIQMIKSPFGDRLQTIELQYSKVAALGKDLVAL